MGTAKSRHPSTLGATPRHLLFFSTALYALSLASFAQGIEINVAVLVPFDDSYLFSYHRVSPAIDLAIEALNQNTRLLRRHHLMVRYGDSKCHIAVAIDKAITFFMKHQMDVLFGPVCDFAVAPVARQISFWDIPMISTGAMALDFKTYREDNYPLLTRVSPINFGMLSSFFSTVSGYYKWGKLKFLYARGGQDYLIKSFCYVATEALFYMLKNMRPDLQLDFFQISEERDLTAEEIQNVLQEEIGFKYAVVVLCAAPDSVREIMIKAHELNFDNGEYVFFNIDLFTSKNTSNKPWFRENDTKERNSKAKQAYEALMTVTLRKPTSPEYKAFSKTVKEKAEKMYSNENFTYGEEEVNSFVGAFHDAVILYALALNESLEAGVPISNGSEITQRMWNRTFEGITGTVSIDANGDRNADYSLLDLDPATETFQVVANYYGNRKQYEPVVGRSIAWAGGRKSPPTDNPECGFDGSKCPPEEPFPEYGIVIIVLGTIIFIVLIAAFFIYRFSDSLKKTAKV